MKIFAKILPLIPLVSVPYSIILMRPLEAHILHSVHVLSKRSLSLLGLELWVFIYLFCIAAMGAVI